MQERALHRIRALLAKADSTTYPAEAEALRSKAFELMAAHGIGVDDLEPVEQAPPAPAWEWDMVTIYVNGNPVNVTGGGYNTWGPRVTFTVRWPS